MGLGKSDISIQQHDNIISRLKYIKDSSLTPLITFLETLERPFIMTFSNSSSVTVTYYEENKKDKNQYDFSGSIFPKVLDVDAGNFPITIVCTNKGYVLQKPLPQLGNEDAELSNAFERQKDLDAQTKQYEARWSGMVINFSTSSWDPTAKKPKSNSKEIITPQQQLHF